MSQPMLRYVLTFAGIHFPAALLVGTFLQSLGKDGSSGLRIMLIYAAASAVGWRFVKQHRRHFTDPERRRLIAGCLAYLLMFDAFGLWGSLDTLSRLPVEWWPGIGIFIVVFELLIVWLSFRYPVRRMMQKRLDKVADGTPNKAIEPT